MRIAHVQPVVSGLVAGGVLAATVTGVSVAASATQPAELTSAVATASTAVQQCQPLQLPTPSPSSTPTTTPTPTPTGSTPTPTPSGSTSTPASPPASTSAPATSTPDPSGSGSTSPSASASVATSSTATTTAAATSSSIALTSSVAPAGQVSLCVAVQAAQSSIRRGQAALWTVTAWAVGGNVPDATVSLTAAPASLKPVFSFGCGSRNGTASCDLGALDASSARRQLQAKVAVAASATTVTSVRLTARLSAANLTKDPEVSAVTIVTAAAGTAASGGTSAPTATGNSAGVGAPVTSTSPLSVGDLPSLTGSPMLSGGGPTLSPGGNASGLFPSVNPSAAPKSGKQGTQNGSAREVANSSALPLSSPVVGAQLAGLIVLGVALVLVVARMSVHRRSALARAGQAGKLPRRKPPGSAGGDGDAPEAQ
jgi:hypothetical protein